MGNACSQLLDCLPPTACDDKLLSYLDTADILRVRRINKACEGRVRQYYARAFNVSHALRSFLPRKAYAAFQGMQAQTGLLIGGRVALDFIRRDLCLEDTMDTFVNRRSVLDVASTLENLDYRYVPDVLPLRTIAEAVDYKADSSTFNSSVVGVHVFRHSSGKRIVVHVARTSTVDCILGYGTSALMNFVSHTSAYALYPKGTLIDRRALFLAPPPWMGVPDDHHSKRAYGYKNTAQVTRLTASRAAHEWGRKFRYVGDDLTCKISLSSATDILDGAMHQSWKLCFRRINRCECGEGRLLQAPYMGRKRVTIPPLRDCANFHYVFADQQFLEAFDDIVQNMRWSHEVWTGELSAAAAARICGRIDDLKHTISVIERH